MRSPPTAIASPPGGVRAGLSWEPWVMSDHSLMDTGDLERLLASPASPALGPSLRPLLIRQPERQSRRRRAQQGRERRGRWRSLRGGAWPREEIPQPLLAAAQRLPRRRQRRRQHVRRRAGGRGGARLLARQPRRRQEDQARAGVRALAVGLPLLLRLRVRVSASRPLDAVRRAPLVAPGSVGVAAFQPSLALPPTNPYLPTCPMRSLVSRRPAVAGLAAAAESTKLSMTLCCGLCICCCSLSMSRLSERANPHTGSRESTLS